LGGAESITASLRVHQDDPEVQREACGAHAQLQPRIQLARDASLKTRVSSFVSKRLCDAPTKR
jgi:hypothetical protein